MTMPDGSTMLWDPSMGWMNGSAGFFGGGGAGAGSNNNTANQNPEKAKPQTEDEDEQEEDEEKGKKKKKEEEEEAEEEEEETEEESEEESEEEEESEDAEEEEEATPAEMEEEESADDSEDSTEDQDEQEQSEEQSSEQASNDSPQIFGLPSPELFVENGKIVDITGETLSEYVANLGAVAQVWNIPETPNLIESIPIILRSRQPQSDQIVVGDYVTNSPPPAQVVDVAEEMVEVPSEDVYVPESPIADPPPIVMEANMIPEPGILLALFIPYIWQVIKKRRRKK